LCFSDFGAAAAAAAASTTTTITLMTNFNFKGVFTEYFISRRS